jgi:uroporphyrin-III C-methyltransferase / precorrin-2 dehydrogenase / sirohydrochlorin ferrochelatase
MSTEAMRYLPIFVDTSACRIVVGGAGTAAVSKLRVLLKTQANVSVFGSHPEAQIIEWAGQGRLSLHRRDLSAADFSGVKLAYLCSGSVIRDRELLHAARAMGVTVNTVDDAGSSDFISPAIVDRNPVVVAISSSGSAPVLVQSIRSTIEQLLDHNLGVLARLAAHLRPVVKSSLQGKARLNFWRDFLAGTGARVLDQHGFSNARRHFQALLRDEPGVTATKGHVSIVGAGPGDPELLTRRAARLLERADVILTDRLVDKRILDLARREALQIEVGKSAGGVSWTQHDINEAMISHAGTGAAVVRLKAGDPVVFGRLDEELDALDEAQIEYDIVPGISSANAAASAIGRSLTRRERNSAVSLITAQDAAGYAEHDWRALAAPGSTFAIYMGVRAARFVQGRLLLHGAAPTVPIVIVERASQLRQRVVNATLGSLPEAFADQGIAGPAVILVGVDSRASSIGATQASTGPQLAAGYAQAQ